MTTQSAAKRLGFKWVTLDDGWQNNVGDWALDPKKFPHGDADMKALVDRIHQEGFKAQLWWSPLSAVPGSELLRDHPDYELLNRDGSRRKVSWWNSYYLCPADRRVVEYHKALVRKILGDWGFDGLKLDGQDMNGVPACVWSSVYLFSWTMHPYRTTLKPRHERGVRRVLTLPPFSHIGEIETVRSTPFARSACSQLLTRELKPMIALGHRVNQSSLGHF